MRSRSTPRIQEQYLENRTLIDQKSGGETHFFTLLFVIESTFKPSITPRHGAQRATGRAGGQRVKDFSKGMITYRILKALVREI